MRACAYGKLAWEEPTCAAQRKLVANDMSQTQAGKPPALLTRKTTLSSFITSPKRVRPNNTARSWRMYWQNQVNVKVKLELKGQATLSWNRDLMMPGCAGSLKSGMCNLYKYPEVHIQPHPFPEPPLPDEEAILHALILALACDEGRAANNDGDDNEEEDASSLAHETPFLEARDSTGTNATLALLVANTESAVALFVAICKARPATLYARAGSKSAWHACVCSHRATCASRVPQGHRTRPWSVCGRERPPRPHGKSARGTSA